MKKAIYLLMTFAVFLTACDPMEDINNEIDAIPADPNVGSFDYTVTADDYSDLGLDFSNFGSDDEAKALLPGLLDQLYPLYGEGSSVLVNYDVYVGAAEGVSDYTRATVYTLSNEDYAAAGSNASGFYPNVDATEQLPAVLDASIADAVDGQIVLVKYKQYLETPVIGFADIVSYNFTASLEDWVITDLLGDQGWTAEAAYVQGNGFSGGQVANIDWLVSPEIDLTDETDVKFQISQAINYANDLSLLKILVSENYDGDVTTATWDEIQLTTAPAGNSNDFIESELYDFSAYDGKMINIAFKYESTNSDAGRWRIESLSLKVQGVTGNTSSEGKYFMYDGASWDAVDDVYYLSSEDYDSMGETSGLPGQYNNFSSSIPADNYIPTFLNIKYPYAQEEQEIIVTYNYYSSTSNSVQIRGNSYTFMDGEWMAHNVVESQTLQFGYENGTWVPDNTVRYSISAPEFAYIASEFGEVAGYESAVASMVSFGNFDRRSGNAAYWSDDMLKTVFASLLDNVIAPNASDEQKYIISYDIYNGSAGVETMSFIKIDGTWQLNN